MNYQPILVYLFFGIALIYLGKKIYKGATHKQSPKACAGCKVAELKANK